MSEILDILTRNVTGGVEDANSFSRTSLIERWEEKLREFKEVFVKVQVLRKTSKNEIAVESHNQTRTEDVQHIEIFFDVWYLFRQTSIHYRFASEIYGSEIQN